MKTLQFEGVKVALKQDKTGYVLTLCMHPDEIPEELLRDFVGARYQVVMVRLSGDETPMDRKEFDGTKAIPWPACFAGILTFGSGYTRTLRSLRPLRRRLPIGCGITSG